MISFALALAIATKACPAIQQSQRAFQTLYATGRCSMRKPK